MQGDEHGQTQVVQSRADTGGPVVLMWWVTLCCTGWSVMCTCVTEGKSRSMAANLSSVSQGHRVGNNPLNAEVGDTIQELVVLDVHQ